MVTVPRCIEVAIRPIDYHVHECDRAAGHDVDEPHHCHRCDQFWRGKPPKPDPPPRPGTDPAQPTLF